MNDILLDINVILDHLELRPGYKQAAAIIALHEANSIRCHISAHEVTTLAYFLERDNVPDAEEILGWLLDTFSIVPVTASMLRAAVPAKNFEDGVIEAAATTAGCEYIVTKNVHDFKQSSVLAITPTQFLAVS